MQRKGSDDRAVAVKDVHLIKWQANQRKTKQTTSNTFYQKQGRKQLIFSWGKEQNTCNVLFLTNKHDFENFQGDCPVAQPWLQA